MHPRISISGLCFPSFGIKQTLRALAELGAHHCSLFVPKLRSAGLSASADLIRASGISVTALVDGPAFRLDDPLSWEDGRSQLVETLDLAADVDAPVVYTLTGRRPSWRWDVAAAAFARAIAPVVEHARSLGIKLALEPTNPLYSDISFVHTVRSGLVLTESCQMFVCLDLYHVWAEADLDATICSGVDRIALVQVSDYFLGDRSMPSRAVPGDGDVPIVEMLSWIDDAGYKGLIDLELSGPRIDVEGDVAAARRGAAFLEACLDRGGSDMSR